jgi:hypothetical protein
MQPAGNQPYDPDRAETEMDKAGTRQVCKFFADEFVKRLEDCIEDAEIEAATLPPPSRSAKESKAPGGRATGEEWAAEKDQAIAKAWEKLERQKDESEKRKDKSEPSCLITDAMTALSIKTKKTFQKRVKDYNRTHSKAEQLREHDDPNRAYVDTVLALRGWKPPQERKKSTGEKK